MDHSITIFNKDEALTKFFPHTETSFLINYTHLLMNFEITKKPRLSFWSQKVHGEQTGRLATELAENLPELIF
jgi:hypothetical protein